jgi:hypothetical protein
MPMKGRVQRISRLVLLALVVAPAVAVAAGGSSHVWTTSTCLREQYKPKSIVLTCGDGLTSLQKLKWSSWSATKARGTGTLKSNTCTPSCAAGKPVSYRVTVTLSKPQSCKQQTHKIFSHAALKFIGTPPKHEATSYTIFCPI